MSFATMRLRVSPLAIARSLPLLAALALLGEGTGCTAYRLRPPPGYAVVDDDPKWAESTHLKGAEGVGVRVQAFTNVRGGTLAYWADDLVRKLSARGYVLLAQAPATSKNGRPGVRFDFTQPPVATGADAAALGDAGREHFYTVVLFATDEHRVVLQVAGLAEQRDRALAQLPQMLERLDVRGCHKARRDSVCRSPLPGDLAAVAAEARAAAGTTPSDPLP
jgi:hypothetical protein